jgi:hypothetical protein
MSASAAARTSTYFPAGAVLLTPCLRSRYAKQNFFLALKPRSSLQGGGNGSHTSLIDDEVDEVTGRFPQLTLVKREKMYYPSSDPTI